MIQGCLFDMDGVLLDTERLGMTLLPQIAKQYGYDFSSDLYLRILGMHRALSRGITQKELGKDYPHDAVLTDTFSAMVARAEEGTLPLKAGVADCFARLKARGIRLALATSTGRDTVDRYFRSIPEIGTAFDAVVCGSEVANSKPAPDIYLKAAEKLDLPPSACIGVEDSLSGLKSLTAAGIRSVMIPDILPYGETFAPFVTWTADSLSALCDLVESL